MTHFIFPYKEYISVRIKQHQMILGLNELCACVKKPRSSRLTMLAKTWKRDLINGVGNETAHSDYFITLIFRKVPLNA